MTTSAALLAMLFASAPALPSAPVAVTQQMSPALLEAPLKLRLAAATSRNEPSGRSLSDEASDQKVGAMVFALGVVLLAVVVLAVVEIKSSGHPELRATRVPPGSAPAVMLGLPAVRF